MPFSNTVFLWPRADKSARGPSVLSLSTTVVSIRGGFPITTVSPPTILYVVSFYPSLCRAVKALSSFSGGIILYVSIDLVSVEEMSSALPCVTLSWNLPPTFFF